MIATDQPTCFSSQLLVRVSSVDDGTMFDKTQSVPVATVRDNRRKFCSMNDVRYEDIVCQYISYDENCTYDVIAEVDENDTTRHTGGVLADALITRAPAVGLMLPVADCVATVVYDARRRVLALLHLGRHSTVARLAEKVTHHLKATGSRPEDMMIWMSPSVHAPQYCMQWFEQKDEPDWRAFCDEQPDGIHLDLQGYNASRFEACGVLAGNIHVSEADTALSKDYFSHSQGDTSGRFVVIAMMRPGE